MTRNSLEISTKDKEREGESREALEECNRKASNIYFKKFQSTMATVLARCSAFCVVDFIVKIGTLRILHK